jgi:hypothetical protein
MRVILAILVAVAIMAVELSIEMKINKLEIIFQVFKVKLLSINLNLTFDE